VSRWGRRRGAILALRMATARVSGVFGDQWPVRKWPDAAAKREVSKLTKL